jgi:hypothetical protein
VPTLDDDSPTGLVKLMLIGDSGSGKTGALASLVKAGYKLGIVDMDSGLRPLAQIVKRDSPDKLGNISYVSLRDNYVTTPKGTEVVKPAKAYLAASRLLNKWEDETIPSQWGADRVFVVDSFTLLGKAALNQAHTVMPTSASGNKASGLQIYGMAQEALENYLAAVMSPQFATNVILITHVNEIELSDGSKKGFPAAVGSALSRHIGKYLNDLFIVESRGQGNNVKRVIRTVPNGFVDAKTSSLDLPAELPIETGLATIFEKLKGI